MKRIQTILAGLLLLLTIQSSYFFLVMKEVPFLTWICFNACAVANFTFLVGFMVFLVKGNKTIMYVAILPLFFFGTGGLFVFPWDKMFLIAQISHLTMTINMILTVWIAFKKKDFQQTTIGLLLGTFIFSLFIGFQQNYVSENYPEFKKIMNIQSMKSSKRVFNNA